MRSSSHFTKKATPASARTIVELAFFPLLVFMKVIQSRLKKHHEQSSREDQAGFRPGRRCCTQIFILCQLIEQRVRRGQRTVIAFIDFKSAFDCIDWTTLWRTLEAEHVPKKITTLLKLAYHGSSSFVRIRNVFSGEFKIRTGVRQGNVVPHPALQRRDRCNFVQDLQWPPSISLKTNLQPT